MGYGGDDLGFLKPWNWKEAKRRHRESVGAVIPQLAEDFFNGHGTPISSQTENFVSSAARSPQWLLINIHR